MTANRPGPTLTAPAPRDSPVVDGACGARNASDRTDRKLDKSEARAGSWVDAGVGSDGAGGGVGTTGCACWGAGVADWANAALLDTSGVDTAPVGVSGTATGAAGRESPNAWGVGVDV